MSETAISASIFSVKSNAGFFKTVHKLRIINIIHFAGCRNTGNPKGTEIALFLLSAYIGVCERTHNRLISRSELLALSAVKALCEL